MTKTTTAETPRVSEKGREPDTTAGEAPREIGEGRVPYFFIDILEVKLDKMQDFLLLMNELLATEFPRHGWKLVSATYNVTGRPTLVTHVWQIPDANSLRDTMVQLAESDVYLRLQECIVGEQQNLLSPMPYQGSQGVSARGALSPALMALGGAAPVSVLEGEAFTPAARVPGDHATEVLSAAARAGAAAEVPGFTPREPSPSDKLAAGAPVTIAETQGGATQAVEAAEQAKAAAFTAARAAIQDMATEDVLRLAVDAAISSQAGPLALGPEDLVICADDGKFYVVLKDHYKATPLPERLTGTPNALLQFGAVVASVNPGTTPGVGAACYVINLPLIRKPTLP